MSYKEFWIGWPDGENPTICDSYDLGCIKFIEYSKVEALEKELADSEFRFGVAVGAAEALTAQLTTVTRERDESRAEVERTRIAYKKVRKELTHENNYKKTLEKTFAKLKVATEALKKLTTGNWPSNKSACAGIELPQVMLEGNIEIAREALKEIGESDEK